MPSAFDIEISKVVIGQLFMMYLRPYTGLTTPVVLPELIVPAKLLVVRFIPPLLAMACGPKRRSSTIRLL